MISKRSVTAGLQTEASLIHIVVFLSRMQPLKLLWCPTQKASGSRFSEHNEPIKGTGRELKCPGLLVWEYLGKTEEMVVLPHKRSQIWGKLSSQGPLVHFLCFGEVGKGSPMLEAADTGRSRVCGSVSLVTQ